MGNLLTALKEIFSGSSQTNPTNIPTCAIDGTPNGNVNMANLVATLGGGSTETLTDANVLRPFRFIYIAQPSTNCPNNKNGYIYTFRRMASSDDGYYHQFYFVYNGSSSKGMWYRQCVAGTWSSWEKISTDIPDFYKNYADLSSLASALSGQWIQYQTEIVSVNTPLTTTITANPGLWKIQPSAYAQSGASIVFVVNDNKTIEKMSSTWYSYGLTITINSDNKFVLTQTWNQNGVYFGLAKIG